MAAVDRAWIDAYSTHFQLDDAEAIATIRQKPVMMAEGMKDLALPPKYFIDLFRAGFPNTPAVELENAGHFCQEDCPDLLVALIDQFIQLTQKPNSGKS